MRRTIVMLVAVAMIMTIFAPVLGVLGIGNANAMSNNEVIQGNEHATHIIAQWHQVGHDEYGDPPGGKSLWQREGASLRPIATGSRRVWNAKRESCEEQHRYRKTSQAE
ncbi:MAG: hypothetical protein R2883_00115 [Caldisericia bacterium]